MTPKDFEEFQFFLEWKRLRESDAAPETPNAPAPKAAPTAAIKLVRELWQEWKPFCKATIASWRICLSHERQVLGFFGDMAWTEINPGKADDYYVVRSGHITKYGRPPSPTYVQRELTTLSIMFAWHLKRQAVTHNPIAGFRRIDEEPYARQTYLTEEEFQKFLAGAHPTFQDIVTTQARCCGMRPAEARELRKGEIDWSTNTIRLDAKRTKKRRARVIPIPDAVVPILKRNCEISRGLYVFVRPNDPKRMDVVPVGTMQGWIKQARERSGMVGVNGEAIVVHTFRHTGVTHLAQQGAPETFIQRAAGMAPKTYARYVKYQQPQWEMLREFQNRLGPKRAATQEALEERKAAK